MSSSPKVRGHQYNKKNI